MKEIKMSDIARKAGVSKSTVSRALKNDSRVNDRTKEKILKIAQKYNYKPNKVAQSLAENNTKTLAVILPSPPRTLSDPFFLEFLHGINNASYQYGYSLTIPPMEKGDFSHFKKINSELNVDGVILTEPELNDPRIDYLKSKDISFVFNGNPLSDGDLSWIDIDNKKGAYQAVNYLIKNGHKNIAALSGPLNLTAAYSRLEGYYQALEENDLTINENWVIESDFTEDGGYLSSKKLLKFHRRITAVFVANDLMALGTIKSLKDTGVKIPEDISIVAFDGIKLGEFIDPALTTVRNSSVKKGEKAVELLTKIIEDKRFNSEQILYEPELIIRDSVLKTK